MATGSLSFIVAVRAADGLIAVLEKLGQPFFESMAQYQVTVDGHAVLSHQLDKNLTQPFQDSSQTVSC